MYWRDHRSPLDKAVNHVGAVAEDDGKLFEDKIAWLAANIRENLRRLGK